MAKRRALVMKAPKGAEHADVSDLSLMGGLELPKLLVSRILKPNMVTKEARQAAHEAFTKLFRSATEALGMGKEGAAFAERYPRVAAHMDVTKWPKDAPHTPGTHAAVFPAIKDSAPRFRVGVHDMDYPPASLLAHEGTHVAQLLGNKDFLELYQLLDAMRSRALPPNWVYRLNEFEQSAMTNEARQLARQAGLGRELVPAPTRVVEEIERMLSRLPADDKLANQARQVLARRRSPKP